MAHFQALCGPSSCRRVVEGRIRDALHLMIDLSWNELVAESDAGAALMYWRFIVERPAVKRGRDPAEDD